MVKEMTVRATANVVPNARAWLVGFVVGVPVVGAGVDVGVPVVGGIVSCAAMRLMV